MNIIALSIFLSILIALISLINDIKHVKLMFHKCQGEFFDTRIYVRSKYLSKMWRFKTIKSETLRMKKSFGKIIDLIK